MVYDGRFAFLAVSILNGQAGYALFGAKILFILQQANTVVQHTSTVRRITVL